MNTEKFLDFNGRKLTLVNSDGKFFVALKPICEVLEIEWDNEQRRLKKHRWLSSTTVNITVVAADNKQREMTCLPEKYIYGWLVSLNPKTDNLADFQRECYEILYGHFHNLVNNRMGELQRRQQLKEEYDQLHKTQMLTNPDYRRLFDIQQSLKATNKSLSNYDNSLLSGQLEIYF